MTITVLQYKSVDEAFSFFNQKLFNGKLPECLITLQRKGKCYGYYSPERFRSRNGTNQTDEIALNPSGFENRSDEEILSTLAHEMVHLWQEHFGEHIPKKNYHNKEWAAKMKTIGLIPSADGAPGGKETGQNMTHYVEPGGKFQTVCKEFLVSGSAISWDEIQYPKDEKKRTSKTKFTCPDCGMNAWAKSTANLMCGVCQQIMIADNDEED